MRFGLGQFTLQIPPWDKRDHVQLYADTLDLAERAERAGFDSIWFAEHHAASDGYNPSSLTFAGAVAARTTTIEVGTGVLLAPFHNPLRIAEDSAVIDNISAGRLNLGLGLGWAPEEYRMFAVDGKRRGKRLEEYSQVLKAAWSDGTFSFSGEFYSYENVYVMPKPARDGGPLLWLGGSADAALRRAAKYGDGHFPPSTIGASQLPDHARKMMGLRRELNPEQPFRFGAFQPVGIGRDADEGWAAIRDGIMHTRGSYMLWGQGKLDVSGAREAVAAFEEQIRADAICGTPAQIVERLKPIADGLDELGYADTFLSVILAPPGTTAKAAADAIDRFGGEVISAMRS